MRGSQADSRRRPAPARVGVIAVTTAVALAGLIPGTALAGHKVGSALRAAAHVMAGHKVG